MKLTYKKLRDRSLKHQVILMFTVMAVCIIIIMAYSFISHYKLQYKILQMNQEALTTQILQEISNNYEYFTKLSTNLAYNEFVQQFLTADSNNTQFELYQSVSNLLINTQNMDTSIIDIAVIGCNQNQVNVSGDIAVTSSLLEQIPKEKKELCFLGTQKYYMAASNLECVMTARWVYPLDLSNQEPCGAVFIAISPAKFFGSAYMENDSNLLEMIILDAEGGIILGNNEIYENYINQKEKIDSGSLSYNQIKYSFNTYEIPDIGYQMITFIPNSILTKQLFTLMASQYLLTLLVFGILSAVFIYFINRFFQTIKQLTDIMHGINSGNSRALKERIDIETSYISCLEAQQILISFNKMMNEIDMLNKNILDSYTKRYETELYAKKTQLAYLRSQINPHFLYNTLALICGMSTEGLTQDIINISQALSHIFRYSVKGSDFVSLKEEFDIVKSYLMIQSERFEGRFQIHYSIEKEVLNARIPKMILQPLVENAIVHGLERSLKEGELQIGGLRDPQNNTLVIWVYDTGVGIPQEQLAHIRKKLTHISRTPQEDDLKEDFNEIPEDENSVGLNNVNTRIRLYYGDEYHLNIDSQENIGTNIQIRIPYQEC